METAARARAGDQALLSLEGRHVGGLILHVELGSVSPGGARYFQIFPEEPDGRRGRELALVGLYHTGLEPAHNWVEVLRLDPKVPLLSSGGISQEASERSIPGLEEGLLKALAELLPPGGHLMVEYESRPDTQRALALGVPPAATPLGNMLVRIGCGTGLKDWYFPEGWSEGPRKLQGYRALNQEHARRRARSTAQELLDFLARPQDPGQDDLIGPARRRAVEVLQSLETGDEGLGRRIGEALGSYRRVKEREA